MRRETYLGLSEDMVCLLADDPEVKVVSIDKAGDVYDVVVNRQMSAEKMEARNTEIVALVLGGVAYRIAAEKFDISPERVRQIVYRHLRKTMPDAYAALRAPTRAGKTGLPTLAQLRAMWAHS